MAVTVGVTSNYYSIYVELIEDQTGHCDRTC